jgi:hypothetical protein
MHGRQLLHIYGIGFLFVCLFFGYGSSECQNHNVYEISYEREEEHIEQGKGMIQQKESSKLDPCLGQGR